MKVDEVLNETIKFQNYDNIDNNNNHVTDDQTLLDDVEENIQY